MYYWSSLSIPYAIGNVSFFSGSTSYPAIQSGPAAWTGVSGSALGFWYAGADSSNYTGYPCNDRGNVWFYQYDLSLLGSSFIGLTEWCPGSSTEQGIQFAGVSILFNTNGVSWHIGFPGVPTDTWRFDLAGIATHEMGHATGISGHFTSTTHCPGTSGGQQTMCRGDLSPLASDSSWCRSLASYDVALYAGRY